MKQNHFCRVYNLVSSHSINLVSAVATPEHITSVSKIGPDLTRLTLYLQKKSYLERCTETTFPTYYRYI